ncbi:DUF4442 domain-containing protein [Legionella jamestowniensis]|uniref:DUF4442 domain-containing protein n=2 Tax=Legionella jamestowniensis TaxID=455 RepID=A0ABX2XYY2_9GAMM|nr:DUF4442 domain-containing protein [Legionella jamestowniensis]OCH99416.1 DUF4442 domain-containing protein [Legionella jamestowniensis]SFL60433.1 protein of unknown function [Legionella jamestowniensis DSM 19215]
MKLSARALRFILNCYPPFLGAGIKVETINSDFSFARVSMRFRWYNKNYMRTQFGGSLYSMTDPFFALMLIQRLGPEFVVWDKHGEINYIKPGESRVYADFVLKDEQVEHIKTTTVEKGKFLPVFHTEIYDEKKQTIATVKKMLYVKRKEKK